MTKLQVRIITALILTSFFYILACNEHKSSTDNVPDPRVERGRYLAETVASCMHCHSNRDFTRFAGPIDEKTKGMGGVSYPRFGTLFSSNITPDSATGIGSWTDDEIARAISMGIAKNGDTLYPIMPYAEYNTMSKEDVYSIVAYLRTLKPIHNEVPARKLNSFASIERDVFTFHPMASIDTQQWNDPVKKGEYLVAIGACRSCHTPRLENERFDTTAYFTGGDGMGKKFGFTVISPNITPDSATGIGGWSEKMFVERFVQYRDTAAFQHNPGRFNTLMPWEMLSHMSDADIRAIYKYLRTLKPVHHIIDKWPQPKEGPPTAKKV